MSGFRLERRQRALEQAIGILKNEEQIQKAVNDPEITVVIGDPLYRQLLDEPEKKRFLPVLHYAVSSKVGPGLCSDGGKIIEEIIVELS